MLRSRFLLVLPALAAVLALAAGCGGGGNTNRNDIPVPANAVAVVAGAPVLRADFDRFLRLQEAAYKAQGRDFPKVGTPQYESIKASTVAFLIRRVERAKEAPALGLTVTDADVEKVFEAKKQQFYRGNEQKYQDELKKAGLTEADVKADLRADLIATKLYDQVTKGVTVTDKDVQAYYDAHKYKFSTPESRDVAHILVKTKKEADDIYRQLKGGADFAQLAKRYSTDPSTKDKGGELTDTKGKLVKEFEDVAFALKTGEIGEPVKSQYGWHIIKALADTKPAGVTPFLQVKDSIRTALLKEKKDKAANAWMEQVQAKDAAQTGYAVGFKPPASATSTQATGTGG